MVARGRPDARIVCGCPSLFGLCDMNMTMMMKPAQLMKVLALALATSSFGAVAAHAACPTLDKSGVPANLDALNKSGVTAKYVAAYVKNPDSVGNSWRLYIRPRNGSCLYANMNYRSPKDSPGHASAHVNPGNKNCEDDYKSYISLSVPSPSAIWGTWVVNGMPTFVGVSLKGTLNPGGNELGIAFVPMPVVAEPSVPGPGVPVNSDDYSKTTVRVAGICFK